MIECQADDFSIRSEDLFVDPENFRVLTSHCFHVASYLCDAPRRN